MKNKLFCTLVLLLGSIVASVSAVCASEETLETSAAMYSDHCAHMDIADAQIYVENNYKGIMEKLLITYDSVWFGEMTLQDIPELRLGEPFVEYNVDGAQFALVYFPVYKNQDAIGIVTVSYYENRWHWYGDYDEGVLYYIWNVLDEVDYENTDTIIYTINNICYVESNEKCVKQQLFSMDENNAMEYSEKEVDFMNLSWSEKKKLVDAGNEKLSSYSKEYWYKDEDHSKYVMRFASGKEDISAKEERENDSEDVSKYVIIVLAVVWIVFIICISIKQKVKRQKNKNSM